MPAQGHIELLSGCGSTVVRRPLPNPDVLRQGFRHLTTKVNVFNVLSCFGPFPLPLALGLQDRASIRLMGVGTSHDGGD